MAPVTLPPSFFNSFWSSDYRTGLDVLFRQLDAGCAENDEIAEFIDAQSDAHNAMATALLDAPVPPARNQTSSLQHTMLALRGASSARGDSHRAVAMELTEHVLLPFNSWSQNHKQRVQHAREEMLGRNGIVGAWEKEVNKLMGLRQAYTHKTRLADDSEDNLKFGTHAEAFTPSLQRSGTVADRISEKLRQSSTTSSHSRTSSNASAATAKGAPAPTQASPQDTTAAAQTDSPVDSTAAETDANGKPKLAPVDTAAQQGQAPSPGSPTHEDAFIPPTDPHGQPMISGEEPPFSAIDAKRPGIDDIMLSGVIMTPRGLRDVLSRFDQYLHTHPAKGTEADYSPEFSTKKCLTSRLHSTILGTYEKTFSGEEFVEWLRKNVPDFGGEWDRCVDAAGELNRMGHISRAGVGRGFEPDEDTYFVLKVKVGDGVNVAGLQKDIQKYANTNLPKLQQYATSGVSNIQTAVSGLSLPAAITSPTSNAASSVHIPSWARSYLPSSIAPSDEPPHIRLRREATKANEVYHHGVASSEELRLEMEQRIERGLRLWERWERERLSVVNRVLKHYETTLEKLPARMSQVERATATAVEAYNPDADFKAVIENSRTGPFRPRPHIYESAESEVPDVNFGVDLRRWSGETAWKTLMNAPQRPKDAIPEVLEGLLGALTDMSKDSTDDQRRKAWIYEIPLEETHMLRGAVNHAQLSADEIRTIASKFNVPIVCGTIKLWFLELNPPVLGWEGWEDAKAVYPSVGADQQHDMSSAVRSVLARLPGCQLFTLNAIIKYWKEWVEVAQGSADFSLVDSTKTEEPNDVYIAKLSLSVGRCILRPQYETELTIQDRTPGLFVTDLLDHYDGIFPHLIKEKKLQQDRVVPLRKRTALVDQRISRSRLSDDFSGHELLEQQQRALHSKTSPSSAGGVPPVPPIPASVAAPASFPQSQAAPAPASFPQAAPAPPAAEQAPIAQPVPTPAPAPMAADAPSFESVPPRFVSPPASDSDGPPQQFVSPPDSPIGGAPPTLPQSAVIPPTPSDAVHPPPAGVTPDRPMTPEHRPTTPSRASPSPSRRTDDTASNSGSTQGLKRNTSTETSRLRGPRGARGPRPQGAAHGGRPSVGAIASQFEDNK